MGYTPHHLRRLRSEGLRIIKRHKFGTGDKCASCKTVSENRLDMDTDAGKFAYDILFESDIRIRAVQV